MAVRTRPSHHRWIVAVCAFATLAGCSTFSRESNNDSSTVDASQSLAQIKEHCSELPATRLGRGNLCVDSGFRFDADDFAFANWGRSQRADSNVTVQTLIDLFGHDAICAPSATTTCLVRPRARQVLEEWNNALAGGRCEGFATLGARFFLGMEDPSAYRVGAGRVSQLGRRDGDLDRALVYWWATQFLPEVTDRAAQSRLVTPLELVDQLIVGLANKLGYTIGMYFEGSGHAVLPFAVTMRDQSLVIHVYDNNHPGERREIVVAPDNTWVYENAMRDVSNNWVTWTGTTGSLELTPMSARRGPFRCTFCLDAVTAPITVSLASRDPETPGFLQVTTRDGSISIDEQGVDNSIDGATWSVGKGSRMGYVSVTLPSTVREADVFVYRADDTIPAGDVVITARRGDAPDVQVRGNLARTSQATLATSNARPVLQIRQADTTVTSPADATARLSVAAHDGMSEMTLARGDDVTIRHRGTHEIEIALKGSATSARVKFSDAAAVHEVTQRDGQLTTRTLAQSPIEVRPRRTVDFSPTARPAATSSNSATSSTMNTVPTSDPNDAPSIVVTLPD